MCYFRCDHTDTAKSGLQGSAYLSLAWLRQDVLQKEGGELGSSRIARLASYSVVGPRVRCCDHRNKEGLWALCEVVVEGDDDGLKGKVEPWKKCQDAITIQVFGDIRLTRGSLSFEPKSSVGAYVPARIALAPKAAAFLCL